MPTDVQQREISLSLDADLFQALELTARQENQSVPQTAQRLIEEGLRHRHDAAAPGQEVSSHQTAALAMAGGSFEWLSEEPDLYHDTCGEAL